MIWLKEVIADLKDIRDISEEEFSQLEEEQLVWKPAPEKWSVSECLQHLIIANSLYLADIDKKLQTAEVRTIEQPLKFSLTGRLFLYFVDPKYTWKIPAPKIFKPEKIHRPAFGLQSVSNFIDLQDQIITGADKAMGYDHKNTYTCSPLSKLLRFNIGEQFYIMMRHEKRHLNQAMRVKNLMK